MSLSILFIHPTSGCISLFSNTTLGGYTFRRLIIIPIIAPFLFAIMRIIGENYLKLDVLIMLGIGSALNMFLLTLALGYIAKLLWKQDLSQKIDLKRSIELTQNIEELTRSKTELEQLKLFSFVTTHDLQEPLHKILMFGHLIKTKKLKSLIKVI